MSNPGSVPLEDTLLAIYEFGKQARKEGEKLSHNHWDRNTPHRAAWDLGWYHQDQLMAFFVDRGLT